jgi:hypothetical protein
LRIASAGAVGSHSIIADRSAILLALIFAGRMMEWEYGHERESFFWGEWSSRTEIHGPAVFVFDWKGFRVFRIRCGIVL